MREVLLADVEFGRRSLDALTAAPGLSSANVQPAASTR
jgi:hypothetical protein